MYGGYSKKQQLNFFVKDNKAFSTKKCNYEGVHAVIGWVAFGGC